MAIDPITAASMGIDVGTTVAGALRSALDPAAIANRKKLKELEMKERRGALGLSDAEKRATFGGQQEALRTSTTQSFNDLSRLQAATGGARSAADMERMRTDQAGVMAEGSRGVARDTEAASLARADQQRAEIEARRAAAAQQRADTTEGIFGSLSQIAGEVGRQAGETPEYSRAAGFFGAKVKDVAGFRSFLEGKGYGADEVDYIQHLDKTYPGGVARAYADAIHDPEADPRLRAIILRNME